jgi:adenylate cyclase
MGVEIERKFLVDAKKWQQATKPKGTPYRQGYLLNEDLRTVRIRVAGEKAFITIKGATSGISRSEFEYEIPVADAVEMLTGLKTPGIEKTRYRITFKDKLWEIDEFLGDNEGLIVAEIELDSEDETFELPDWIKSEVSDDSKYYNSNLSKNPFKNWH